MRTHEDGGRFGTSVVLLRIERNHARCDNEIKLTMNAKVARVSIGENHLATEIAKPDTFMARLPRIWEGSSPRNSGTPIRKFQKEGTCQHTILSTRAGSHVEQKNRMKGPVSTEPIVSPRSSRIDQGRCYIHD